MTPMPLRLFVNKLQPIVGLALFAYFVVEVKSKTKASSALHTAANRIPILPTGSHILLLSDSPLKYGPIEPRTLLLGCRKKVGT